MAARVRQGGLPRGALVCCAPFSQVADPPGPYPPKGRRATQVASLRGYRWGSFHTQGPSGSSLRPPSTFTVLSFLDRGPKIVPSEFRMRLNDVELPQPIIEAQKRGKLVLFAGAG